MFFVFGLYPPRLFLALDAINISARALFLVGHVRHSVSPPHDQ